MRTRPLGNSDLAITPIGLGAWAIGGGDYRFGWGDQDDQASIRTIHAAIEAGINWIDTAPVYGLGRSEEVVGRALKGMASQPYVFTKCERVWDDDRTISPRLKRASIRRECEDSLRRLGVEVIDLLQIHWPQPDEDIEEGWQAVLELKSEGKIRWGGLSNFSVDQMNRVAGFGLPTSLQPPYHLLRRDIEAEILPYCRHEGIGVISYSPMASGLLTGRWSTERVAQLASDDWRKAAPNFQSPALERNLRVAAKLAEVARRHGRTAGEAAIAWVLRDPVVTGAIVGMREPNQVPELIGAMEFRLSSQEVVEIEATLPN